MSTGCPQRRHARVFASGFTKIIDIAFGSDGIVVRPSNQPPGAPRLPRWVPGSLNPCRRTEPRGRRRAPGKSEGGAGGNRDRWGRKNIRDEFSVSPAGRSSGSCRNHARSTRWTGPKGPVPPTVALSPGRRWRHVPDRRDAPPTRLSHHHERRPHPAVAGRQAGDRVAPVCDGNLLRHEPDALDPRWSACRRPA